MRWRWLWLGVATVLLAACTADNQSPAPPTTATTTTATVPTTIMPATTPPLTRTLDVSPYGARACGLLTNEQLASLDLTDKSESKHFCGWQSESPAMVVHLALSIEEKVGNWTGWDTADQTMVRGQPAVVHAGGRLYCLVLVWTTQTQGFSVDVATANETPGDTWCAKAVAIAETIVGNLDG